METVQRQFIVADRGQKPVSEIDLCTAKLLWPIISVFDMCVCDMIIMHYTAGPCLLYLQCFDNIVCEFG